MTAPPEALEALRVRLAQQAALTDSFRPQDLLRRVAADELQTAPLLATRALAALRSDCTVETGSDGEVWMMRPGSRRKVLGDSAMPAEIPAAADSEIGQALAGQGDYAPAAIEISIAAGADPARLQVMATALDRAGAGAPAHRQLSTLRAMLNHAQAVARTDAALQTGFFGREGELAVAAAWIAAPQTSPPLTSLHIAGLPGIGKSYLLERVIQCARQTSDPIIVRLDFDRAGLQISDAHTFFDEISRQLADNLPQVAGRMRQLRLDSAAEIAALTAQSQSVSLPRGLLEAMGAVVRATQGRTVLIVLDTLEVLRTKGDTHIRTLFEHLDKLVEFGMPAIAVLSAGRGDALDPAPHRMGLPMALTGLEEPAARMLLAQRNVPPAHWPRILRLTRGNPLQIVLAARAVEVGAFDEVSDDADLALLSGYLYRAILSRVPADLRRIAQEGLIMRWINAAALREVVAPVFGLELSPDEAAQLLDLLAAQHWLVTREENGLRHRADMRAAVLPLIYHDAREAAARIDARAAEWFAAQDPLSALYHRLQLTRSGTEIPGIPLQLAQAFTGDMLDELPPRAADAVRHARGQRSDYGRSGTGLPPDAPPVPPSPAAVPEPPLNEMPKPAEQAQQDRDTASDAGFPDSAAAPAPAPPLDETGIPPFPQTERPDHAPLVRRDSGPDPFGPFEEVFFRGQAVPVPARSGIDPFLADGMADPSVFNAGPAATPAPPLLTLTARYDGALRRVVLRRMPAGADLAAPDDRAVSDLRIMLERNELREADHILANGLFGPLPVDSMAGVLMMVQQWQAGHWATARVMFDALPAGTRAREVAERPHLNGRILLEIEAEYDTDDLLRRLQDPGFGAQVRAVMVQSGPIGLIGGALEIATVAAGITNPGSGAPSVAATVLEPWIAGGIADQTAEWRYRSDKMRDRWGLTLTAEGPQPGPAFAGRAVAPLLPQTVPLQQLIARLAESSRPGPLPADLIALRPALPEAVALFMPELTGAEAMLSRLTLDPADTIEALSLTGLLAHWLSGYALHGSQPNLWALARAAERWRRASQGRWSHGGRPPAGWRGGPVDAETDDLIARWMKLPDPVAIALRALRIWVDPAGTDPGRGAALARQRLLPRYRSAIAAATADADGHKGRAAIRSLVAAGLPGCIAAPLAVLTRCGVAPDSALPGPGPGHPDISARKGLPS